MVKIEGKTRRRWQRMRWVNSVITAMNVNVGKLWGAIESRESWYAMVHGVTKTEQEQEQQQQCFTYISFSRITLNRHAVSNVFYPSSNVLILIYWQSMSIELRPIIDLLQESITERQKGMFQNSKLQCYIHFSTV